MLSAQYEAKNAERSRPMIEVKSEEELSRLLVLMNSKGRNNYR